MTGRRKSQGHDRTGSAVAEACLPPLATDASGKRGAVLRAAVQVFLSEGYGAASMDRIAAEARVSKATVYAHFGSKEALFAAIIRDRLQRLFAPVLISEPSSDDVGADLRAIARQFVAVALAPDGLAAYRMVVAESARFPELGRAFYEAGPAVTIGRLASYFAAADRRGLLCVPDPALAAEQFISLLRGPIYLRRLLGVIPLDAAAERDMQRVVDAGVDAFLKIYAPA